MSDEIQNIENDSDATTNLPTPDDDPSITNNDQSTVTASPSPTPTASSVETVAPEPSISSTVSDTSTSTTTRAVTTTTTTTAALQHAPFTTTNHNVHIQFFSFFFRRISFGYARLFPHNARRVVEFAFLLQAFLLLGVLVHLHITFVRYPVTCLDKIRPLSPSEYEGQSTFNGGGDHQPAYRLFQPIDWHRDGIVRVEVLTSSPHATYSLADSYAKQSFYYQQHAGSASSSNNPTDQWDEVDEDQPLTSNLESADDTGEAYSWLPKLMGGDSAGKEKLADSNDVDVDDNDRSNNGDKWHTLVNWLLIPLAQTIRRIPNLFTMTHSVQVPSEESYIMEYALEYGFLRLSPATRQRLNISVLFVVLDPKVDVCFGNRFVRFLLDEFLGYEDLLFASFKRFSSRVLRPDPNVSTTSAPLPSSAYIANVVTGQHHRFILGESTRSSYLVAGLVMILFTFCVSALLRYSSNQLLFVIARIVQLFETNTTAAIQAAPFLTVILAIVATETIMSEFFGDALTAFYVIVIVSLCDHYEAIFCRTEISRRYWPRFFFIYHFSFYAYQYRFNGQFSGVALWVSWLFTLHSMLYFFHHYELPYLLGGPADVTATATQTGELVGGGPLDFLTRRGGPVRVRIVVRHPTRITASSSTTSTNTGGENAEVINRRSPPPSTLDDSHGATSSSSPQLT